MTEPKDFQTFYIEQKARRLLAEGKVKFEGKFENNIRFRVSPLSEKNHEHLVFLDVRTREFHCDCRYCALHPDRACAQIRACAFWLEIANKGNAEQL